MKILGKIFSILKSRKYVVLMSIISLIALFFVIVNYYVSVENGNYSETVHENSKCDKEYTLSAEGDYIIQEYEAHEDCLRMIGIRLDPKNIEGDANVRISVIKDENIIQSWEVDAKDADAKKYIFLTLSEIIDIDGKYNILIENLQNVKPGYIAVYGSSEDSYKAGSTIYNDELSKGDIAFAIIGKSLNVWKKLYIAIVLICALILLYNIIAVTKGFKIENLFIVTMTLWGIMYMIVLPPFTAADEESHFSTAYKISNSIMFKDSVDENGKVYIREEDSEILYGHYLNISFYKNTVDNIFKKSVNNDTTIYNHDKLSTPVVAHLPAAIGITVARALNFNNVTLLYMGRFFQMMFYVITVYFAIKIMPFKKIIIYCVSMIPMMIEMVASFSYDAVINALAILFFAYIIRLAYSAKKITAKDIIITIIIMTLLAPCKIIYSSLVLLIFLIPKEKFGTGRNKYIYFFAITACIVVVNLIYNASSIGGVNGNGEGGKFLTYWNEEGYTLSYILQHPVHVMKVWIRTLINKSEFYIFSCLGTWLGWHEIGISRVPIMLVLLMLLAAAFIKDDGVTQIKGKDRLIIGGTAFVIIALACAAMFIGWTPITSLNIEGVQGRYFLPAVPLLLIIINNNKVQLENISNIIFFVINIANIMVVMDIIRYAFCHV